MAGSAIRVDYEAMADSSRQLRDQREEFIETVAKMRSMVNSLPDIWEGETCDKYVDQFADLERYFNETSDLIEDLSIQLDSISTAYRENDEAIASKVGVR